MAFGVNDTVVAAGGGGFGARDEVVSGGPSVVPERRRAASISDAVKAGLQDSSLGLLTRGKLPDVELEPDAPWYMRAAKNAAALAGDTPAALVGGLMGYAGGGATGAVVTPGPPQAKAAGALVGANIGGWSGAMAVPMALREALVEAYSNSYATSWEGIWEITKAAAVGGGKGAAIGAVTLGAGKLVGAALPAATSTAGRVAAGSTVTGAELVAMTTTASALEGHLPTWQDFMDNAILLGGTKAVVHTAKRLLNVYAETGKRPEEALLDAAADPKLKDALASGLSEPPPVAGAQRAYHGAFKDFDNLKPNDREGAIFLTSERAVAQDYADSSVAHGGKPRVITADVSLKNPLVVDAAGKEWAVMDTAGVISAAKAAGHDGVIFRNIVDTVSVKATNGLKPSDVFAVFDPKAVSDVSGLVRNGLPPAYAPLALEQRVRSALDKDKRPELVAALLRAEKDPNAKVESPLRFDYIFDRETLEGVVAGVKEAYAEAIETQTRGQVPVRDSVADGMAALKAGELKAREIGVPDAAKEVFARAFVAKSIAENAQKLADSLPKDITQWTLEQKLQFAGAMEQVSMAYGEYRGGLSETARGLNMAWQLKRDSTLLNQAEGMAAAFAKNAKSGNFAEMAAMVRSLKDPAQIRAFAEKVNKPTVLQRVIEPWRAGIFSGVITWTANLSGNTAKWFTEVAEKPIQTTITAGRRALSGDPLTAAQFQARAMSPLYGLQLAVMDGIHLIAEGKKLVEQNGWVEGAKKAGKATVDRLSREDERMDLYKRANQPGADNVVESAAGYFASASFGMLKMQDLPFRTIGERQETRIMAVDRAVKEGWHPATKEFREAVERYVQNPTEGLSAKDAAAVTDRIEKAGAEAVFGQRLGPTSERVSQAISGTPWEFLVPARRTPANLLSWAAQHTPGLNFLSGRWREDFAAGGERRDAALARVVVGTGLAATAFGLMSAGMLTGNGLPDKEMGGTKSGAGWQPASLKIGDTYYSIARIEPVAKVLLLAADMREIIDSPKITDEDRLRAVTMTIMAFANATISTTYLSGLSNAMRAALDPERYAQAFVESYATSLVPKVIGQVVTITDPYKREVDGALEALQSQLPYFRQQLLSKRDVWGDKVENKRLGEILPVTVTTESKNKVKTEAVRLQIGITDAPDYFEEKGPFKPSEKRGRLTDFERDVFKQVSGGKAMEFLSPVVGSPDWDKLPDYVQAKFFRETLHKAREFATWEALPPTDPKRNEVRQKLLDRIIQETEAAKAKPGR
jgi:hypothetical protein